MRSKKGKVIDMGIVLLVLFAAAEIFLAVTAKKKRDDKAACAALRLKVRAAELGAAVVAVLLPYGQKWRLTGLLIMLAILTAVAALKYYKSRRDGEKGKARKSRPVLACVLNILLFAMLLMPAFLFTGYKGLPVSGPHWIEETSAILIDASRTDPFEQDGSFREVPVHFYYPADAAEGEKYPLIVFSHGAFGYYQSNTSTYMELASNGYVVAALDHPHHAFFTTDSDGKTVLFDRDFFMTAMSTGDPNEDAGKYFALFGEWMELRTADMNFVLDTLETAADNGALDDTWFVSGGDSGTVLSVLGMTDMTRIGLIGHSMGGATAVQVGRERGEIAAVVDLDGTMLGEYTGVEDGKMTVSDEPYPLPVLDFDNWTSYNDRKEYLAVGYVYPNNELYRNSETVYSVTIRDTEHMDFTDLPLLSPALAGMLGSGARDKTETMNIVNGLVLDFFNAYLKGEGEFTAQEIY